MTVEEIIAELEDLTDDDFQQLADAVDEEWDERFGSEEVDEDGENLT